MWKGKNNQIEGAQIVRLEFRGINSELWSMAALLIQHFQLFFCWRILPENLLSTVIKGRQNVCEALLHNWCWLGSISRSDTQNRFLWILEAASKNVRRHCHYCEYYSLNENEKEPKDGIILIEYYMSESSLEPPLWYEGVVVKSEPKGWIMIGRVKISVQFRPIAMYSTSMYLYSARESVQDFSSWTKVI